MFTRELNMRVATGKRVSVVSEATFPEGRKRQRKPEPARAVPPDIEETPHFSSDEVADVQRRLLDWYDRNHRVLPWRRNFHSKLTNQTGTAGQGAPLDMPQQQFMYHVWVCEVMSQQTQVPRAAQYFSRWVAKWPAVQELAKASMDEVNEMWAGLGYYRRARYLLEGAKYVMQECGGEFPSTSQELQKIPGVGAYTGAAMASIACGERVAVVDANVMRILARLRCLEWDLKSLKQYAAVANTLVDPDRPGDFNQAVMELGATVCTIHQTPSCGSCPVRRHCHAFSRQQQQNQAAGTKGAAAPLVTDFPIKAKTPARREETAAVCAVELQPAGTNDRFFLLVQRPKSGLLAGLWEFPLQLVHGTSGQVQVSQLMDMYLNDKLGLPISQGHLEVVEREQLGDVTHTFSHIQLTMRVERLLLKGTFNVEQRAEAQEKHVPAMKWVAASHIQSQGLSSSVKKVLGMVIKSAAKEKSSISRYFAKTNIQQG